MQVRRKKKYLIEMYSSFYLNKTSLIIFGLSIILLMIIFLTSIESNISRKMYEINYESIINAYFNECFFAATLIIAIFSIFLGSMEGITQVSKFDAMFVGNNNRFDILLAKIIAFIIIDYIFISIVFLILFLIPTIKFDYFTFKLEYLKILINIIIWSNFILFISMIISLLIQNYFSPLLVFIYYFLMKLMSDSSNKRIKNYVNAIFPQIYLNQNLSINFTFGTFYVINLIIIMIIVLNIIYSRKNLKNS